MLYLPIHIFSRDVVYKIFDKLWWKGFREISDIVLMPVLVELSVHEFHLL